MKRLVTLLLVAAVSLSLCACGQTDPRIEKYENYQLIIECLENGDYDKALDIIEGWAGQHSEGSETISAAVPTEPTKPALTPEQIAWQTDAVGTWIPSENASKDGHTGFTVKADGTCTVDGKDYTWEIGHSSKTSTQITVLDGQTKAHMLQLSVNSDYGYKTATLFTYKDDSVAHSTNGTYYRNEDYTVVEITNDNWQDYFEVKEVISLRKNAFGEINQFCGSNYFRLKDTYGAVNANLSTGGVEYKYVSTCQDVTVDLTNKTYEPVGKVKNTSDHNSTTEMHNSTDANNARFYGVSIGGFTASDVDKDLTDTVWRPMDIEIRRVQATLYIVK